MPQPLCSKRRCVLPKDEIDGIRGPVGLCHLPIVRQPSTSTRANSPPICPGNTVSEASSNARKRLPQDPSSPTGAIERTGCRGSRSSLGCSTYRRGLPLLPIGLRLLPHVPISLWSSSIAPAARRYWPSPGALRPSSIGPSRTAARPISSSSLMKATPKALAVLTSKLSPAPAEGTASRRRACAPIRNGRTPRAWFRPL